MLVVGVDDDVVVIVSQYPRRPKVDAKLFSISSKTIFFANKTKRIRDRRRMGTLIYYFFKK